MSPFDTKQMLVSTSFDPSTYHGKYFQYLSNNVCFLTMCASSQKILLRVVILSICIVHDGGNNERKRGIQHYNSSYTFPFGLWNNLAY